MAARLVAYIVASIVAVTFIAGLLVGAQRDTDGPVDLVIVNGRVFTGVPADDPAEAVAVQGNKILRVGTNREVQRLARAQTIVVDARGGSVLPGFNDAHVHALSGGLELGEVNLVGAHTLEAIGSTVRQWAASHADQPWITGRGWSSDAFPGGQPTRQQLDQWVPDRPAVLRAEDGRAAW
ncbi:MAG: amidohydrolase family protein, partial [Acidobacteria bacterium]|nr:amidohydrolase family protein [Acidobacteriota bacterium]